MEHSTCITMALVEESQQATELSSPPMILDVDIPLIKETALEDDQLVLSLIQNGDLEQLLLLY